MHMMNIHVMKGRHVDAKAVVDGLHLHSLVNIWVLKLSFSSQNHWTFCPLHQKNTPVSIDLRTQAP